MKFFSRSIARLFFLLNIAKSAISMSTRSVLFDAAFMLDSIYVPQASGESNECKPTPAAMAFSAQMSKLGYAVEPELFRAVCALTLEQTTEIVENVENLLKVHSNWTALTRNWLQPTGINTATMWLGILEQLHLPHSGVKGTMLPCGHFIPDGTFPLERYNGCPVCGTLFSTSNWSYAGQGSTLKPLRLATDDTLRATLRELLESKIPAESTPQQVLALLIAVFGLPDDISTTGTYEAGAIAFDVLSRKGMPEQAKRLVHTAADVFRYLWCSHTAQNRIVRPKTLVETARANVGYRWEPDSQQLEAEAAHNQRALLKLKYNRSYCRFIADILNTLPQSPEEMCEGLHPYRGMWVRFVRALRLSEFARRAGYEHLGAFVDIFYRGDYPVWQGMVEQAILAGKASEVTSLLAQRPSTFARALIATLIHLGPDRVLPTFEAVAHKVPVRLLVTLDMYALYCLTPSVTRVVHTATGARHTVGVNPRMLAYTTEQLEDMAEKIQAICRRALSHYFEGLSHPSGSIYIAPELFLTPIAIGERAHSTSGDMYVPQGRRFDVQGNNVRLFLHWGEGLPAQHLDLDLSAAIQYDDHTDECAYYDLNPLGAVHSGDIQNIPDNVGAAEYIELDIPALAAAGARSVLFAVNAYSVGAITPTARVGWMDCAHPMAVDNATGVAYDPSTVQFAADIRPENVHGGIIFGVLDIESRQIMWLEMGANTQNLAQFDLRTVNALCTKLRSRMSIGTFLTIMATAQHRPIVSSPDEAETVYDAFTTITSLI